jgi:ornithine decarboxylase
MIPRDVKSPTVAIPFNRMLKVVAIVDEQDPQTRKLLDGISAENIEVEISGNPDRAID